MGGSVSDCIPGWMGAGDSTPPGFTHCPGTLPGSEESFTASGGVSWLEAPRPTGAPTVPMLGPSTMGRTSRAVLADVVSVGSVGSLSGSRADCPNAVGLDVTSAPQSSAVISFSHSVLRVDVLCALHPLFVH